MTYAKCQIDKHIIWCGSFELSCSNFLMVTNKDNFPQMDAHLHCMHETIEQKIVMDYYMCLTA